MPSEIDEIIWNDLVKNLKFDDRSFPTQAELDSLNWGNRRWTFFDGEFQPLDNIPDSSPDYIDFSKVGDSKTFFIDGESDLRKKLFRIAFHQSIVEQKRVVAPQLDNKIVFLTHGPIASGKTSAIDTVRDNVPGVEVILRVDYDLIKKDLPEYQLLRENSKTKKDASSILQAESAVIAAKIRKKVQRDQNQNMIIEGSHSCPKRLMEIILDLKKYGYVVYVISTIVPFQTCVARAYSRYLRNGRFVPTDRIRESYEGCAVSFGPAYVLSDHLILFDQSEDGKIRDVLFDSSVDDLSADKMSIYFRYLSGSGVDVQLLKLQVREFSAKMRRYNEK